MQWAAETGRAITRFDYSGHGESGGDFAEGTISRWLEEAAAVLDRLPSGPQILVGSSMGGWIAAAAGARTDGATRRRPHRRAGAAGAGGRHDARADPAAHDAAGADRNGDDRRAGAQPSAYSDTPYVITKALIEDGERHLLGDRPIAIGAPVHIIQGVLDEEVPWGHAVDLVSQLGAGRCGADADQGCRPSAFAARRPRQDHLGRRGDRLTASAAGRRAFATHDATGATAPWRHEAFSASDRPTRSSNRLPPGQYLTEDFPGALGRADAACGDSTKWSLHAQGRRPAGREMELGRVLQAAACRS